MKNTDGLILIVAALTLSCSGNLPLANKSLSGNSNHIIDNPQQPNSVNFPFEPVGLRTYAAKVKMMLTGLAVSDDEIAVLQSNPNQFAHYVETWLDTDQAQSKLLKFYGLALQQAQMPAVALTDQVNPDEIDDVNPQLADNMRNSMALTAQALVQANRPFSEVVTTHSFMMTTAMMSFYLLNDQYRTNDNDTHYCPGGCIPTYRIVYRTPAQGGPIALQDSLNPQSPSYMVFTTDAPFSCTIPQTDASGHVIYNADGSIATQTRTYTERVYNDGVYFSPSHTLFMYFLKGQVDSTGIDNDTMAQHDLPVPSDVPFAKRGDYSTQACRFNIFRTPVMTAQDFSDWRMVTIEPPTPGSPTPHFYDLPAIRGATQLALATPRVGFFSHPAFLANYPTNISNQARDATNQALIVALGQSINPIDKGPVSVLDTTGADAQHSDPQSACYSCHRVLDPMRNIFLKNFTFSYHLQDDPAVLAQTATFDFGGVQSPLTTLDDFASVLATHPAFPTAWVQKLCFYFNSAACSEDDPEFLRLAATFRNSNFNFKQLLVDFSSSPIVTGQSVTKTWTDRGEVVTVARYNHLCTSLTNRLQLTSDLCSGTVPTNVDAASRGFFYQQGPSIAANIPKDGYARGAQDPVLATQPSMFFRAAAERLCEIAADFTVDQPGSRYQSTTPRAALADYVTTIMGVTPSDPDYAAALAIVTNHYQSAIAAKASATLALRSAFMLACTSPLSLAVGL